MSNLEQQQQLPTFEDSFSEEIWRSTYKHHEDETVEDTFRRVAKAIASVEETEELRGKWEDNFFDMLQGFKVVPGGRILSNAGAGWKGTSLINCFVAPNEPYDMDSLKGILNNLEKQASTLKSEGGWGENFSYIRPRGSFIKGIGVESPGAIKYMELFDKSSDIVTSGSGKKSKNPLSKGKIRKGAMMGVLNCDSPDIIEFITAKQTPGRLSKFNLSVNCTDKFMDKVLSVKDLLSNKRTEEAADMDQWDLKFPVTSHPKYKEEWDGNLDGWERKGYPVEVFETVSATGLWDLIMKSTYNRAEPGVLFLDRANYYNPLSYGEKIKATNPSMPAGTLVHTKEGIFPIELLQDRKFEVKSLDGTWAKAECFLSGDSEPLLEFKLGNFKSIKSTKQHRWPVYDQRMGRLYKVDAENLRVGDLIPMNRNERIGIHGDMSLTREEGLFVGYLIGDGWFNVRAGETTILGGITFGKHEKVMAEKLLEILNSISPSNHTLSEKVNEYYFQFGSKELSDTLRNRYKLIPGVKDIPQSVWEGNDEYIEGFVDGLLSADGSVYVSKDNQSIQLTTSRASLANNFAKLLSFAGIGCSIFRNITENVSFPNGVNYNKEYTRYDVKVQGQQFINFNNVFSLTHPDKSKKISENILDLDTKRKDRSQYYMEVREVTECPPERVWDISVYHKEHIFPVEWCYTGNCGEQTLAPAGICCLSSLNLTQFINQERNNFDYEKLHKYLTYAIRFLDNINSYSNVPLPEYKESMETKRRIGIGIMGWGSSLFCMKLRFSGEEASKIREELMSFMARTAYELSIDLAVEKGMFSKCVPELHVKAPFIEKLGLSEDYLSKLATTGIRNSALLSIQPTGNTGIVANIVSGGLEPIFMPEYIRTVIVSITPDHIKEVTPLWNEGRFEETELFKFSLEGDEQILRGVDEFGTTYKIDKNRGLTKEVLCEDYGVRYLKRLGEWNPEADWAVTTTELSAEDHVNDLKGFAYWIDSAVSKTINLPNDYSYDDFQNIYLDAYKTGYIKGLTTYRAGTMTTVLSAKEEATANKEEEEIILDEIKLPSSLPATLKTLKAEGRKWYLTLILDETNTKPVALFVQTNHNEKNVVTSGTVDRLLTLAATKGIPEKHILDTLNKSHNDNNPTRICRAISLCLRHGIWVKNVVAALNEVECVAGSFVFHIRKFLANLIRDGEKADGVKCSNCGGINVVYQESCFLCKDCGSSKCG